MHDRFTLRPLPTWPYPQTRNRRGPFTFKADFNATLALLAFELNYLDGSRPIIAAGFDDVDLRLDGMPRAHAIPLHPGVEISFDTRAHGRLVYATDVCDRWQHNVRSIALGLEALRAVDRYGITRRGEQYAGWRQLTTGVDGGPSLERGRALIREAGSVVDAIKATHPDAGGDPVDFQSVTMAREAGVA
jgi:hypothetical protein